MIQENSPTTAMVLKCLHCIKHENICKHPDAILKNRVEAETESCNIRKLQHQSNNKVYQYPNPRSAAVMLSLAAGDTGEEGTERCRFLTSSQADLHGHLTIKQQAKGFSTSVLGIWMNS